MELKLDNPVWYALGESHQKFAIDYHGTKFYHPDYCPFGGFLQAETTAACIDKYSELTPGFYVVGDEPAHSAKVNLVKNLVCLQMVLARPVDLEISSEIVELNEPKEKEALFELVNLVQPGYFRSKTSDLGTYYGVFRDGGLMAVTGERMKMNQYTEVSAVVTHPAHTGKGYAKQLVAYTSSMIFKEGKIPFLHVAETNTGAIALYEKLGFVTRRKISFWNFVKK